MVTSLLDEVRDETGADGEIPLSDESEREILEMVENQLDRPNPPDTRVLYRRAMHFIDRDVRHLSLQQFNAKFPLQVKRRRARERLEENGGSPDGAEADSPPEPSRPSSSAHRTQSRGSTMAVDRNPDVMELVERELRENPDVSNRDLKLKAEEIDEEIEDLSARQFNARYPLQVKRRLSAEQSGASESDGETKAAPAPAAKPNGDDGAAPEAAADGDGGGQEEDGEEDGDLRDRIMDLVRRLLRKEEELSTREMQERAAEIDPGVEELSTRQFHARYPLQVKRKLSSMKSKMKGRSDGSRAPEGADERREVVREALLDFAKAVAGAEDRGEVIDVLTRVDEYVDRVVEEM